MDSTPQIFSSLCNPFLLSQTILGISNRESYLEKRSKTTSLWAHHHMSLATDYSRAQAYHNHVRSRTRVPSKVFSNYAPSSSVPTCAAPSDINPNLVISKMNGSTINSPYLSPPSSEFARSLPASPVLDAEMELNDIDEFLLNCRDMDTEEEEDEEEQSPILATAITASSLLTPPKSPYQRVESHHIITASTVTSSLLTPPNTPPRPRGEIPFTETNEGKQDLSEEDTPSLLPKIILCVRAASPLPTHEESSSSSTRSSRRRERQDYPYLSLSASTSKRSASLEEVVSSKLQGRRRVTRSQKKRESIPTASRRHASPASSFAISSEDEMEEEPSKNRKRKRRMDDDDEFTPKVESQVHAPKRTRASVRQASPASSTPASSTSSKSAPVPRCKPKYNYSPGIPRSSQLDPIGKNTHCDLCNMTFGRTSDLIRHEDDGERHFLRVLELYPHVADIMPMSRYKCSKCPVTFTRKDALQRHNRSTCKRQ
ncbi:hypothetical protein M422DRAFT_52532 [Sphaerobolus stellatus SS14]|uniref:Unplaced genomic scaffold SPHSTscaffold_141, whole genome shotgun sequence n=1 Tax=Sphaerobolus stellatus (strain SS14) TaxID=990650 RepID=A0A0C9TSD9_SPHS4|nr:hypothetical protein M422DRAFT_52532 [Sphaerobolus stellatus SS14]